MLCGEALSLQRLADAALTVGDDQEARAALSAALVAVQGSLVATRHMLDRIHGTAIRAASDPAVGLEAVDEAARAVRGPAESCPPCSANLTVPAAIACADAGEVERAAGYPAGAERVAGGTRRGRVHLAPRPRRRRGRRSVAGDRRRRHRALGQGLDASHCRRGFQALTPPGKVSGRSVPYGRHINSD